jgi:2-oxoisovalerate dehydrogenase E1 component beta subunit
MPEMTVIQAINSVLASEMRQNDRIFILGQDVGHLGGVFHATDGLAQEFGSERVIDAPLAESSIIGICVGAAIAGMYPVAEIQFADFIHSAADHIINEAAKVRYRSNNGYGCPLVIRTPYGAGIAGGLYHSQSIEALFTSTPGLKVVAPSTPYDTKGLLLAALRDMDPVLFLEHKRSYRGVKGEVPDEDYVIPIGLADVKRSGSDVTVITYGMMVHEALQAAETLSVEGYSIEVLDLRTLAPLDIETICASVRKTGKALIAHEDNLTGGLGGEVAAIIADACFLYLDAPIKRLASPDIPMMPFNHQIEMQLLPGHQQLTEALRALASY